MKKMIERVISILKKRTFTIPVKKAGNKNIMLTEVKSSSGKSDDARRWFSSVDLDLVIWEDPTTKQRGFQLDYKIKSKKFSFTLWPQGHVSHPDASDLEKQYLLEKFIKESQKLPADLRNWIITNIVSYQNKIQAS